MGKLVNMIEGSNQIWDGSSATGNELNPGVYYYVVTLNGEVSGLKQLSGHITLLR
jgi:hypothetical protein